MTHDTGYDAVLDPRTGRAVQLSDSETLDDVPVIGEEDDEDIDDEEEIEDDEERPFIPFSEETNSISGPDVVQDDEDDQEDSLDRNI